MNKTILITGASTGIGRGTANYFAEKGWNVAATMRSPEKAEGLKTGDKLKLFRLDVQDKASISQAIQDTIAVFGKIDVVLNNAGYGAWGPLESATDEQIRRQFDVNMFGVIDVIRAITPHFRERKEGLILNVSSVGGRITTPYGSLYHGTKWGLEGLTEALTYELNPLGIRLKIIEPGGVKTDFAGRSLDLFDNKIEAYEGPIQKLEKAMGNTKMMPSTPEDIAKVIWKAANSSSNKLRYPAGNDSKMLLLMRKMLGGAFVRGLIRRNLLK